MKKLKAILAVILVISMAFMFAGCSQIKSQIIGMFGRGNWGDASSVPEADLSNLPYIENVDFAYEIEYFNSTMFNTFTLKVGDVHTPTASVWAGDEDSCYSSDESVVFAAKNGNVFAKGVGTAYVVIRGVGDMFEIYKYIVKE